MNPRHSLRRLLLLWLLPPVLIMLALSMLGDYAIAVRPATEAYDQPMKDAVLILKDHLNVQKDGSLALHLSPDAEAVLQTEQDDRLYFAIFDDQGRRVEGSNTDLPTIDPLDPRLLREKRHFSDTTWKQLAVRMMVQHTTIGDRGVVFQIVETTNKRKAMSGRIIFGMFLPELLTVASIMIAVWIGVGRGLAPLDKLEKLLTDIRQKDLTQLPESQTPSEIYGLVHMHNVQAEKLHEMLTMQEHFITNAAHQLRTPLAGLQSQSELALHLVNNDGEKTELQRTITNIHTAAVRSARLVQQLLGLARSTVNADAFSDCDLALCAENVANRFMSRAVAADVDLGLELGPAPVSGLGTLLEEAISNLLDNALKYCPRNSSITISTLQENEHSMLVVEDDGPGIPAREQERIFERFYRLNADTDGAGLGLAIVKEIAALHGADIRLGTGASGQGLRVEIRFPLASRLPQASFTSAS